VASSVALVPAQTVGGSGGTNKEQTYKIDLAHSLWVTNEKEQNFGSIFGYPRLGYAYSYWWSYWFRWAIADRAFERKADPSVIVYHPDGEFINEDTGERMSHSEYALLMGERMRSGGVIALPSEVYEDANGTWHDPSVGDRLHQGRGELRAVRQVLRVSRCPEAARSVHP
jgi:hypothetical protein